MRADHNSLNSKKENRSQLALLHMTRTDHNLLNSKDENIKQLARGELQTRHEHWTGNVPSWHARFGLDGAAMLEFHMIQGPNTRDARDKITFFAFHTFLVEVHPNGVTIESGPN